MEKITSDQGVTLVGIDNVAGCFIFEWITLLASSSCCSTRLPSLTTFKVISAQDKANLIALPYVEEIEGVFKNFKKWKASRSDGFPTEFYQTTWPTIKDDVVQLFVRFLLQNFYLR